MVIIFQEYHTFRCDIGCCLVILFIFEYSVFITVLCITENHIQDSLACQIHSLFIKLTFLNSLYDQSVIFVIPRRHLQIQSC